MKKRSRSIFVINIKGRPVEATLSRTKAEKRLKALHDTESPWATLAGYVPELHEVPEVGSSPKQQQNWDCS